MRISIITPSYNQGKFIERTILSVKNQKYENLEHIIFDNNSSDNTSIILNKYKRNIKFFSELDTGQSNAVNKGLKIATGDIIGWLNSDDIYYPNAFKHITSYFLKNPNIDVIYGEANHIDKNDNIIDKYDTKEWDEFKLRDVCYICQPALFFRKSVLSNVGLLNEQLNYCMDYDYWIRFALNNLKVKKINKLIAGSRLYDENKTLGSRLKVHSEINYMLRSHFNHTPNKWIFNYAHVKTESLKVYRSNKFLYLFCILLFTFYSSLKWNRKISKDFFKLSLKLYGLIK